MESLDTLGHQISRYLVMMITPYDTPRPGCKGHASRCAAYEYMMHNAYSSSRSPLEI